MSMTALILTLKFQRGSRFGLGQGLPEVVLPGRLLYLRLVGIAVPGFQLEEPIRGLGLLEHVMFTVLLVHF